ncbi:MAG: diaminopimelate epimerase, partial [Candidatus Lokiarchaeota archaeon]|nr:diaminopimelate epimerase [Candidatus Lokiarchaeota archaeon]MBD3202294.1 diaminopimelate epimerase [Candidatus Lokiarchaeota archaeon]
TIDNFKFEKFHGLGNDYILVNDIEYQIPEEAKSRMATKLCEPHFSIGADGLIFVSNSDKADIQMRIFNSDGSEAEMCGNGVRCFAKYVYEKDIIKKEEIKIETLKGLIIAKLNFFKGKLEIVRSVEIDMGAPIMECEEIPVFPSDNELRCINETLTAADKIFNFSAVSMGNPHAIIFVKDVPNDTQLNKYGALIESHNRFPNNTNVEFVKVISNTECILRVFERGVGITNSCGTGSCAAVVAGVVLGKFKPNLPILVHNDGGDLVITFTGETVFMEGPIEKVYEGLIKKLII